jgi:hypothetical protein
MTTTRELGSATSELTSTLEASRATRAWLARRYFWKRAMGFAASDLFAAKHQEKAWRPTPDSLVYQYALLRGSSKEEATQWAEELIGEVDQPTSISTRSTHLIAILVTIGVSWLVAQLPFITRSPLRKPEPATETRRRANPRIQRR